MRDDLVAVEIEVHPFVARSSFGTAEQVSIEGTRFGKIAHREGQMETGAKAHAPTVFAEMRISKSMRSSVAKRRAPRALLAIDGRPVEVTLRLNRRARRLIVKVNPTTGEVVVVAPSQRALDRALDFAK